MSKEIKDPAFLFYSRDFYEGTRTMLPEERACYIDLMVYQHQNGYIPNDLKRLLMYCSGISEATLNATLHAKFTLCDKGWFNKKLKTVCESREKFSEKQSINGIVGNFFKLSKKELSAKDYKILKQKISQIVNDNEDFYNNWMCKYKEPNAMLNALRYAKRTQYANANAIANEDENENEDFEKGAEKTFENKQSVHVGDHAGITETKINFPFTSETFPVLWAEWKAYRKEEFKKSYKSPRSEQAALSHLESLSKGNEDVAREIIMQSIANGWQGLFELKQKNNGKLNGSSQTNKSAGKSIVFDKP